MIIIHLSKDLSSQGENIIWGIYLGIYQLFLEDIMNGVFRFFTTDSVLCSLRYILDISPSPMIYFTSPDVVGTRAWPNCHQHEVKQNIWLGKVIYLGIYSREEDLIPVRSHILGYDCAIIATCRAASKLGDKYRYLSSLIVMNIVKSD